MDSAKSEGSVRNVFASEVTSPARMEERSAKLKECWKDCVKMMAVMVVGCASYIHGSRRTGSPRAHGLPPTWAEFAIADGKLRVEFRHVSPESKQGGLHCSTRPARRRPLRTVEHNRGTWWSSTGTGGSRAGSLGQGGRSDV